MSLYSSPLTCGFLLSGAYSDSSGIEAIRKDVAKFIEERDGFPTDADDIFLSSGASEAIRVSLIQQL